MAHLTNSAARHWLSNNIHGPDDVVVLLDALEDVAHESASELASAWQDRRVATPWTRIGQIAGRARLQIHKMLKQRFGYY